VQGEPEASSLERLLGFGGDDMNNVYYATRPIWASLEPIERYLIAAAGGFLSAFAVLDCYLNTKTSWWIIKVIVEGLVPLAIYYIGFIWLLRRLRIGCYPSTFVYCFQVSEESNPGRKRKVVGYLRLKPERDKGEMIVEGTSITWVGDLVPNSQVRYNSTNVHGGKKGDETTCHIRFDICKQDWDKRNYRHGLLQFRLVPQTDPSRRVDQYAAYMRATHDEFETVATIRSKGYAEKVDSYVTGSMEDALRKKANSLFTQLDDLLDRQIEVPTLWTDRDILPIRLTNRFGHTIVSPQSVLLSPALATYVDAALDKMLTRRGFTSDSIVAFKKIARRLARQDEEWPVETFRVDLKDGLKEVLTGVLDEESWNRELLQQAETVRDRIREYLNGTPPLDVGWRGTLTPDLHAPLPLVHRDGNALPSEQRPPEQKYDTVLLLNVLHHSDDPLQVLSAGCGKTKKRLIVMEPAVGVRDLPKGEQAELAKLEDGMQFAYVAFVDWFYNCICQDGVAVGHNFATPEQWESNFARKNLSVVHREYITDDPELEPMPHVLFVLEKQELGEVAA
jgi:hypothetical protein